MNPEDRISQLYSDAETSAERAFKTAVPVGRYIRSLDSMNQIYKVYVDDRKYENAYILQIKMVVLFLKFLKKHPEYDSYAKLHAKEGKQLKNTPERNIFSCFFLVWNLHLFKVLRG